MKTDRSMWGFFLSLLCGAGMVALLLFALGNLQDESSAHGREQLEESLYRASLSCYALEGRYPPTLDYLTEHYGILVDSSRYHVFYEVFGDNLMPQITVQ